MNYFKDYEKLVSPSTPFLEMWSLASRYMALYKVFRDRFIVEYGYYFQMLYKAVKEDNLKLSLFVLRKLEAIIVFSIFADIRPDYLTCAINGTYNKLFIKE